MCIYSHLHIEYICNCKVSILYLCIYALFLSIHTANEGNDPGLGVGSNLDNITILEEIH